MVSSYDRTEGSRLCYGMLGIQIKFVLRSNIFISKKRKCRLHLGTRECILRGSHSVKDAGSQNR